MLTTCALDCPDRCSILCEVDGDRVRIRGNPDHPRTRGFTCAKIRRYPERLRSPHRIREPWVRVGDRFRPASWEEALERVCADLKNAREEAPASVLHVRGGGSKGASKGFVEYVFEALGARSTRGSLCDEAGIEAIVRDAGRLEMNDPREIERAEAIVLWGKHPAASSIHAAAQVIEARRRGVPVLAVNPDGTAVASLAEPVIAVRPGTDRFLALACTKLLLARGAQDPPWEGASNPEKFRALLDAWDVPELLELCGVSSESAQHLADVYAATPRVATLAGWGLQRYPFGGENLRAIHALAFVAGTLTIPGGGLYYNVPSSRHLTRPRAPVSAAEPLCLPTLAAELRGADPPVRVAWFTGSNLLNQGPDCKGLRAAFGAVRTRVVVDGFWTETARHATVILPPALWLEEEDLAGSCWHRGVGAIRRALEPPEGCRTDFEIAREVAANLGLAGPWDELDAWLAACLPDGAPDLDEIRRRGWWEAPGQSVAWADGFAHSDGRFRLLETLNVEPTPDSRHPFRLLTVVRRDALHSQMLPEEQLGSLAVRIHPVTAENCGLEAGAPVRIVSPVGEIEGEVHLDPNLHPDAVVCPRGGWASLGMGVNEATEPLVTDMGDGTAFYGTAVRLEAASGHPPRFLDQPEGFRR